MNGHSRRNFLFQAAVAAVPLGAFGARRPQHDDFTGMNANAADKSQIFDALAAGDDTAALELLEQTPVLRFARDGNGQSLLLASAIMGRATVIQKLTDSGVAPDVYEAAALGLVDHVTSLLKEYPGLVRLPNLNGDTPMHLAALCGHADIVANSIFTVRISISLRRVEVGPPSCISGLN